MHFAPPIPLWAAALVAAALVAAAVFAYRRPLVPLTRAQRVTLITLRAAALLTLLTFFCRPLVLAPPAAPADVVVPIVVDTSRSMGIADESGNSRLNRAVRAITADITPAVANRFKLEVFRAGDGAAPAAVDTLRADAPRSDLREALAAVRERFRGRPLAGIVLISDGGDTGSADAPPIDTPVFAIGVGSRDGIPDREVTGITAGDPRLDRSAVDVHVTASSRGFGRSPFDLHISANGRLVDTRHITPSSDGVPVDAVFTVAPPDESAPTIVAADIAPGPGERILDNNTRTILISPRGRKRRVLVLEGAPGFEHSFLTRALAEDPDLEVDSIARKGKNDAGQDTFFVQAPAARAPSLTPGFPARREDLFAYDAVIVGNMSGDVFTRAQMSALADFVAVRGGGLLVLGGLSFAEHGLAGTPLEPVLPVDIGDRHGTFVRSSADGDLGGPPDTIVPTAQGLAHPVMRLGATAEETRKKWAALPTLAGAAPLGGPKPGATVLAVVTIAGGALYPAVAVQPYGQGRSMVFGGEAAWRWRMMRPATDRTYELFWRQAVRWLAATSPDPVAVTVPQASQAGDAVTIQADVRNAEFVPVPDAIVSGAVTLPGGEQKPLAFRPGQPSGRFSASFDAPEKGVYRVQADASRGKAGMGRAERWLFVGGADRELADPRLNEGALRRIARATGGEYAPVSRASAVGSWLDARSAESAGLEPRDVWQQPWLLALAVLILSAEWVFRRQWGLR